MKARVKATGDIIEISEDCSYLYAENYDKYFKILFASSENIGLLFTDFS